MVQQVQKQNQKKKAEKITLADGTIQYEVDLKEKTTKIEKEVLINAEGTSKICEH